MMPDVTSWADPLGRGHRTVPQRVSLAVPLANWAHESARSASLRPSSAPPASGSVELEQP